MAIPTTYKAYDDEGNEIFLYHNTVITPIAYVTEAREICYNYCISRDIDTSTLLLPYALSPTGSTPITHYACFDHIWSNVIDDMAAYMTAESAEWTANKLYTISDSATEIKSLFVVLRTDTEEEVLTHLGLQRVI